MRKRRHLREVARAEPLQHEVGAACAYGCRNRATHDVRSSGMSSLRMTFMLVLLAGSALLLVACGGGGGY
jgi:hypothetical protein